MKAIYQITLKLIALTAMMTLAGCSSSSDCAETPNFAGDAGCTSPPPPTNSAPTISGNAPAAVKIGDPYSFTPQASDPDGDTLTFSIQNKPVWADFDSSTGTISGTPLLADIGSYSNIGLSVSDGALTTAMANFTIAVTQIATASTTLSWTAPTLNEDGSVLTDLAGFKIYFGTSSGNYSNTIRIDNPSITTYVVDNLNPVTYFFAATAFNASGVESAFSGEVTKALN